MKKFIQKMAIVLILLITVFFLYAVVNSINEMSLVCSLALGK